jgi:hypothetical protein
MRRKYVETLAAVLKEAEVYTVPPEMKYIVKLTSEVEFRKMIRTDTPIIFEYDRGRMFCITFMDLYESTDNWISSYFFNNNDLEQEQYSLDFKPYTLNNAKAYRRIFGNFYDYLLILANICGTSVMPIRKDSEPNAKFIDFDMCGMMVRMCIQEAKIYKAVM